MTELFAVARQAQIKECKAANAGQVSLGSDLPNAGVPQVNLSHSRNPTLPVSARPSPPSFVLTGF